MEHNRLGKSDIHVSEIGFGCMSLPKDKHLATQILERAVALGITFFDTADLYDQGDNERVVGAALGSVRKEIVLASKVGNRWNPGGDDWRWDASPEWIKEGVYRSLERLQTDYLDLYQLHGGTLEDDLEASFAAFEDLQREGVIRSYGISSIRPNVIRRVAELGISSNMMQYSLLDRRPEEAALEVLAGVGVIARGPVAKGLLASKPAAKYLSHSAAEVTTVQKTLTELSSPTRSRAQIALRFALSHEAVTTVIPGASTLAQLEDNVGAANVILSESDISKLKKAAPAQRYQQHR